MGLVFVDLLNLDSNGWNSLTHINKCKPIKLTITSRINSKALKTL